MNNEEFFPLTEAELEQIILALMTKLEDFRYKMNG